MNGAAIRAIREAKGWNLSQFASKALLSTGYLSRIESGEKTRLGVDKVARIAELLGVPTAAITSVHYDISEAGVSVESVA